MFRVRPQHIHEIPQQIRLCTRIPFGTCLFWNYARSLDFHSNCTHPGFERTSQVVGRNTLNAADPHSTRSRDHGGKGRAHLLPSSRLEAAVRIHP